MSYKFNSIVNKQEADALKEMIFRRARERAESMNEAAQSDVMDLARNSFVSKNNPFSQIIENAQKATNKTVETTENSNNQESKEIGFPQRELKPRAVEQARSLQESASTSEIQNNMLEARNALSSKSSFMGALDFLNSQAAVSLMRTRADKFEAVV